MESLTRRNLRQAIAGESEANRRYLAYAQKADDEGFKNVARLFRAIAATETIHANNHLRAAGEIQTTLENAQKALRGEVEESTGLYPMFMDQAKRDADNEALTSFFYASEAEKTHADLYEKAVDALNKGHDMDLGKIYICKVCGYTVEGNAPEKCYTCGEGKEAFVLYE
jgi:rubrerythrin